MTYYSRRQLEALGEPLGENVTQTKPGGHGRIYGAGGGSSQPTETKVTNTNLPDYLQPQVEAGIGAATQEFFTTREIPGKPATFDEFGNELTPAEESTFEITGVKPFIPYSTNMQDYFAGFSPLQQQVQYEAAGMQRPAGFDYGSQMSMGAGMGGMQSAQQAYGYGGMGAGYGAQGAGYGQQAAGIGQRGLGYQGYGADIGRQAMGYGQQAAGMGGLYEQMATSPEAMQAYMSPYARNVIEQQKESAIRDAQKANLAQNLGSVRSGTYGGSRQLLAQTERERALASQLANIEAQGLQSAYDRAQQAQQFGITSGLQGLQGAQQGLGTALQGGQLGLSGIQQALAGQQAGIQGAQAGMQGAQVGLQGVSGAQAGYGLGGQQAATLANIAQQQQAADLARMQFQGEQGASQQAMEQNFINQAIQNYAMAQQYPQQQIAAYNALLRGYAIPTTTVSQYQAAPSAASQAMGFGTAGIGLAQLANMGKKEGGKIKEKKYAAGGLTDLDQKVLYKPTSFSPEAINRGMQNDSINDMIGAIALSEIGSARKKAEQAQAMQKGAPQGTVLAQLQQAAGIDSLPTNLAPTQTMAGGGIVAFEDGGYVEPIRFQNEGLVPEAPVDYSSGYGPMGKYLTDEEKLRTDYLGKDQSVADLMSYIQGLEGKSKERAERLFNLRLIQAGLGMAGGKSRYALENIATGATPALEGHFGDIAKQDEAEMARKKALAELSGKARAEKMATLEGAKKSYQSAEDRASRERTGLDKVERIAQTIRANAKASGQDISLEDAISRAARAAASPADRYNALSNRLSAANKDIATRTFLLQQQLASAKTDKERAAIQAKIQGIRTQVFEDYSISPADLAELQVASGRAKPTSSGVDTNNPLLK